MKKCSICQTELSQPYHHINNEDICDDCWFNELGNIIEQYPIGGTWNNK